METVEYCIMHNGYYIQEGAKYYYRVNDIDKATMFTDLDNMIKYVQDDMKLNIANVDLIKLVTSVTESVVEL